MLEPNFEEADGLGISPPQQDPGRDLCVQKPLTLFYDPLGPGSKTSQVIITCVIPNVEFLDDIQADIELD